MPLSDGDKLNRIEELKSKLFNKNYQTKIEYRDSFPHFQKKEVMDSWEKKETIEPDFREKFFMKTSIFRKFFTFSLVFFVLALGYGAYMFFANSNTVSNDNIDISVQSNAFTAGGEDYPLLLQIINRNNSPLLLADLIIEYPKSSDSSLEDNEHIRLSLGTIPAGGIKNENVKLVLFGEQGSTKQIKTSLEYRIEGSNAIFVKEKIYEVSINSTPINLSIDAPTETTANQDITLNVEAALNATKSVSKMLLKMDYPVGPAEYSPFEDWNKKETVNDLAIDDNNLFVASSRGLAKLNLKSSQWSLYTTKEGLMGNNINQVAIVNGKPWVIVNWGGLAGLK